MLSRAARWGNRETKRNCAVGKLIGGTGGRKSGEREEKDRRGRSASRRYFPLIDAKAKERCIDRKSTRLNSSHSQISYAVFCLKKKLNAWERAGADASSAGMVDAGFENQKELTKMQLDNQKEIAEMQNETKKEIAGIQSATSRQNTKEQVYAQNEMLFFFFKKSPPPPNSPLFPTTPPFQ